MGFATTQANPRQLVAPGQLWICGQEIVERLQVFGEDGVVGSEAVVVGFEDHQLRARDARGELASTRLEGNQSIAARVHDQGWNRHLREEVGNLGGNEDFQESRGVIAVANS